MSRRRKQLIAAAVGGGVLLAILLAVVLASGGSNGSGHSSTVPASTTKSHAQDRAQITALALAYQNALTQKTSADPCNYFDPQSRAWVNTIAKHRYVSPISCATAAREGDVAGAVASGNDYPPGIDTTTIQFGQPNQQVRCGLYSPPVSLPASQQGLSWAIAGWAGANGNQVAVIKENGRWWIDVLLCHG